MRPVNLVIALLLATSASAQTHELTKLSVENDNKVYDIWKFRPVGDKLTFLSNNRTCPFTYTMYYFDGKGNTAKAIQDDQWQGAHMFSLLQGNIPAPDGKLYFSAFNDADKHLYVWDGINPIKKIADVGVGGTYCGNDITFSENKMYFTGYFYKKSRKLRYLFEIDLKTYELKQLTDDNYSPDGVLYHNNKLYFVEQKNTDFFHVYDLATNEVTTVPLQIDDDYKNHFKRITSFVAVDSKVYLNINTPKLGDELYEYDGETLHMVADFAKGKSDGLTSTILIHNGKLYFTGNKNEIKDDTTYLKNLYQYDPLSKKTTRITSYTVPGREGKYPYCISSSNDKLYYATLDGQNGVLIYEYDDRTNTSALLTQYKSGKENSQPIGTTLWNGSLYFIDGWFPGTPDDIYRLDLNDKTTSVNNNTLITTPQVKVYPNPTSNATTIEVLLPRANKVHLTLTDVTGKQVYEYHTMSTELQHSIYIPMQQLAVNTYIYSIVNDLGEQIASGKLVKE